MCKQPPRYVLTLLAAGSFACRAGLRDSFDFGSADDAAPATGSAGDPGTAGASGGGHGGGDDGPRLDVGPGGSGAGDEAGEQGGCEKADFLFVVDNSGSMLDNQQNLAANFPGFIAAIRDTLMAQDYHIMVVDTDAASLSFGGLSCTNGTCMCTPMPQCCIGLCHGGFILPAPTSCGGQPCSSYEVPMGCDATLGAGKNKDPLSNDCGVTDGRRFMVDGQPDLTGTFECVALVGAGGDGNERPMEAVTEAIGPLTAAGQCNEGFLRDDAILVVVFITDEEDAGKSQGNPASWKQALVSAKHGDESAVVVLGLVGDSDVAGGICDEASAEPAPILRGFAEGFVHGDWGSVCAPDYRPFFEDTVSVIDAACDDFTPPG